MRRVTSSAGAESVEWRELRVFLMVAEELHFGCGAKRLCLTPSRVSQSLRQLERKLAGRLFHRTSRRVVLTAFGERFVEEAAPAYEQLATVLERACASSDRFEGTLRLGLLFPTAGGPHLTSIVQAFEERHPGCEVELKEVLFDDPLGPLRRGDIDLLATPAADRPPRRRRRTGHVERTTRAAGRPGPSPRHAGQGVDRRDRRLHVIPLSGFPAEPIEAIIPHATPTGRPIRRRQLRRTPRTPFDVEALIARGLVVHPTVPSYAEYFRHPDIVSIPINHMPPATTGLVWPLTATDACLHELVRTTRELLTAKG